MANPVIKYKLVTSEAARLRDNKHEIARMSTENVLKVAIMVVSVSEVIQSAFVITKSVRGVNLKL